MNNILTRKACLLFIVSLSLCIFGCGSGGDGSNQNSVSLVGWEQECGSRSKSENIIQNAAIGDFTCCLNVGIYVLWNWMTGSYKPYPNRPISMPTWPTSYTHSSWPMLSFAHPPDWTPNEFTVPNELIGVELVRNDNKALYQNLTFSDYSGSVAPADQWFDNNIDYILNLLNENGQPEVQCSLTDQELVAPGIVTTGAARAVTAGQTTLLTCVGFTSQQGVLTQTSLITYAGPSDEFSELTYTVFMNIIIQMIKPSALQDHDGDGTPDVYDHAPANPNIF